jgi:hypothetical protein
LSTHTSTAHRSVAADTLWSDKVAIATLQIPTDDGLCPSTENMEARNVCVTVAHGFHHISCTSARPVEPCTYPHLPTLYIPSRSPTSPVLTTVVPSTMPGVSGRIVLGALAAVRSVNDRHVELYTPLPPPEHAAAIQCVSENDNHLRHIQHVRRVRLQYSELPSLDSPQPL